MTTETSGDSASEGPDGDTIPAFRYNGALASRIEQQWRDYWDEHDTFATPNPVGPLADADAPNAGGDKLFIHDMFPYPSGDGLHMGHVLGYTGTDVYARFQRMAGRNVLYPMGFDSFGLPAEQYAVETGQHPAITTAKNIDRFREQQKRLGFSYDRRREVHTTDPGYYRWTQWIFSRIFDSWYDPDAERPDGGVGRARPVSDLIAEFAAGERETPDGRAWSKLSATERAEIVDGHRLAYVAEAPVNWCPGLGTVVANEEVTADGRSDRGNFPVFKRTMRQWMMRITDYADRLLEGLDALDWSDALKTMQRNWIGRSTGARIDFESDAGPITVFTTRPDTLFGATFLVLAPEHPLVAELTTSQMAAQVVQYRKEAAAFKDTERQDADRQKTGVFTGSYATNPATGQDVPIWIADYVLMGYGTGAIMAVPCGDQRDFEFAQVYGLDIPAIQQPPEEWFAAHRVAPTLDTRRWAEAFVGDAPYVNSSNKQISLDGISSVDEAIAIVNDWLEENEHGEAAITYKLRDWLFSRQRYWGEPFPIVYGDDGFPRGAARPHAARDIARDRQLRAPHVRPERRVLGAREPTRPARVVGRRRARPRRRPEALPPRDQRDAAVGGFLLVRAALLRPDERDRVLRPRGRALLDGPARRHPGPSRRCRPLRRRRRARGAPPAVLPLLAQGALRPRARVVVGAVLPPRQPGHRARRGVLRRARGVRRRVQGRASSDGAYSYEGRPVSRQWGRMGKSLKNGVDPESVYDAYGADTLRLHMMSAAPLDQARPWESRDVVGMHRFLQRVWRNIVDEDTGELRVVDAPADEETRRLLHRTIDTVRGDLAAIRYNTAIAKVIELNNHVTKLGVTPREVAEPIVLMLAPLVPHVAEELWSRLGHEGTIAYASLPEADPGAARRRHRRVPGAGERQGPWPHHGRRRRRHRRRRSGGARRRQGDRRPRRRRAEEGHRRPRPHGQRRRLSNPEPDQIAAGWLLGNRP